MISGLLKVKGSRENRQNLSANFARAVEIANGFDLSNFTKFEGDAGIDRTQQNFGSDQMIVNGDFLKSLYDQVSTAISVSANEAELDHADRVIYGGARASGERIRHNSVSRTHREELDERFELFKLVIILIAAKDDRIKVLHPNGLGYCFSHDQVKNMADQIRRGSYPDYNPSVIRTCDL